MEEYNKSKNPLTLTKKRFEAYKKSLDVKKKTKKNSKVENKFEDKVEDKK